MSRLQYFENLLTTSDTTGRFEDAEEDAQMNQDERLAYLRMLTYLSLEKMIEKIES